MWAGAYAEIPGYVWARSEDDAFEIWVDYLDDNAPGCLTSHEDAAEYLREYCEEHDCSEEQAYNDSWEERYDLTTIGHTTLKHGAHIPSYEWGLYSIDPGTQEYREAFAESVRETLTCDLVDIADALSDCEPPCEVSLAYPRKGGNWNCHSEPDWYGCTEHYVFTKAIPECTGCEDTGCSQSAACEDWEAIAQELIAELCECILADNGGKK